jgi:lipoyl(octanoyl) transferase
MNLEIIQLGPTPFEIALRHQDRLVEALIAGAGRETLLLLEHEPVYTIGRTRDQSSLLDRGQLPHPVIETNRGGQATFHGPGQLVGYPILDLNKRGRDLHNYLRSLETALITLCQAFDIPAARQDGLTGVWVENRKIASLGVGVRKWITMHGFALNVTSRCLDGFQAITPCGIAGVSMTSMETENGRPRSVAEVAMVAEEVLVRFLSRDA